MADEAGDSMDQGNLDATGVDDSTAETGKTAERTFTQADLDRIVQDRLSRERAKYEGFDDLKAKAEKLAEIEAANQTELEREKAAREAAEKALEDSKKQARDAALRAAIVAEAAKSDRRIADPEATVTFLTGPDADLLEVGEDGSPTDIAKAMDSLLERRDYLVAKQGGARGNADQGARTGGAGQVTESELKSMSWQQIEKARSEGRLKNLLGAS